jgi:hypothetical protein
LPADRVKPLGTTHALLCARPYVKGNFAIINADDYYGVEAFRLAAEYLNAANGAENNHFCMVGYGLSATLTENGTVSRGVCESEDGYLVDVNEVTKIQDCKAFDDEGNVIAEYDPETLVSMNMWGLTPDIFDYLLEDFKIFLKDNLAEPKKEFYIPLEIDSLIKRGEKKVKILSSDDRWYGVTYREDKQGVVDAIAEMTAKGMYD